MFASSEYVHEEDEKEQCITGSFEKACHAKGFHFLWRHTCNSLPFFRSRVVNGVVDLLSRSLRVSPAVSGSRTKMRHKSAVPWSQAQQSSAEMGTSLSLWVASVRFLTSYSEHLRTAWASGWCIYFGHPPFCFAPPPKRINSPTSEIRWVSKQVLPFRKKSLSNVSVGVCLKERALGWQSHDARGLRWTTLFPWCIFTQIFAFHFWSQWY